MSVGIVDSSAMERVELLAVYIVDPFPRDPGKGN